MTCGWPVETPEQCCQCHGKAHGRCLWVCNRNPGCDGVFCIARHAEHNCSRYRLPNPAGASQGREMEPLFPDSARLAEARRTAPGWSSQDTARAQWRVPIGIGEDMGRAARRRRCQRCWVHRPRRLVMCLWGCGREVGTGCAPPQGPCLLAEFYLGVGACVDCLPPRPPWLSSQGCGLGDGCSAEAEAAAEGQGQGQVSQPQPA